MCKQSFLYWLGSLVRNFPRIIALTKEDVVMKATVTIDFF